MIIAKKFVSIPRQLSSPRIVQIFFDADLRGQHPALTSAAKKNGIALDGLPQGALVCFVNKKRNRIKFLAPNSTLAYYRSPDDRALDLRALGFLDTALLLRSKVDYDGALKESLEKYMGVRDGKTRGEMA